MSAITPAPKGVALSASMALSDHVLRVLQGPVFQAVIKREGWQLVVRISAEARAAWLRT